MSTSPKLENLSAIDFGDEIRAAGTFLLFSASVVCIIVRQLPDVPWPTIHEGSECHRNKNKIMISITYMNFPQNTLYSTNSKRFPPIYNYLFVMIKFFPRIIRDQMHIVKEKLRFRRKNPISHRKYIK